MIPCRHTTSMRAGRCHQTGPQPREMSDRPVGKAPRQVVGRCRNSRWPSLSVQSLSCIQQICICCRLRHLLVVLVNALIQQSGIGSGRCEQRSKKYGVVRHSDAPSSPRVAAIATACIAVFAPRLFRAASSLRLTVGSLIISFFATSAICPPFASSDRTAI